MAKLAGRCGLNGGKIGLKWREVPFDHHRRRLSASPPITTQNMTHDHNIMTMAADGTVKPATAMATLVELPPASSNALDGSVSTIRLFQLTLNNITVELSSLGASITKVLLPRTNTANTSTPGLQQSLERDDVVLSYATQNDQYDDGNRPFFGAIVGRVANRIKDGRFQLLQSSSSSSNKLETYQLEKNNYPNHLHGGTHGFRRRIWNAAIVNNTIQFTLISPDLKYHKNIS